LPERPRSHSLEPAAYEDDGNHAEGHGQGFRSGHGDIKARYSEYPWLSAVVGCLYAEAKKLTRQNRKIGIPFIAGRVCKLSEDIADHIPGPVEARLIR